MLIMLAAIAAMPSGQDAPATKVCKDGSVLLAAMRCPEVSDTRIKKLVLKCELRTYATQAPAYMDLTIDPESQNVLIAYPGKNWPDQQTRLYSLDGRYRFTTPKRPNSMVGSVDLDPATLVVKEELTSQLGGRPYSRRGICTRKIQVPK